ncbi:hypothetical protein OTU49_002476 [Cherax quadricarinatus]|uniref:Cuticle protein n=1 Tax=Cherax quadricarinatus TaxID=27406 RepID=A0AAW0XP53_CHEQU
MKIILALCLLGLASAATVFTPYSYGAIPFPYSYGAFPYTQGVLPYNHGVLPYSIPFTGGVIPYSGAVPTVYSLPLQYKPIETKIVQPGYVAKTPGATHIAPLPAGLGYASHHINTAAAPGTD